MYRASRVITRKNNILIFLFLLLIVYRVSALDFSILNRGEIIFQEILIETDQEDSNYYFNFGITGLEPGARHNIHISSTEDLIFCSFYLFGISNENYIIENVAIEQNSIVYILPEHYHEAAGIYDDVDNPDAVYGAHLFDRSDYAMLDEESPENQYKTELELFNYTNSTIFRVYCTPLDNAAPEGEDVELLPPENLLGGKVLNPQESISLELVLVPEIRYKLQLKGPENRLFEKELDGSSENDFLVFYDSDIHRDWENIPLSIINNTEEELKEIFLIDQESGKRLEILDGDVLSPESDMEFLLTDRINLCDIIVITASDKKSYIFDWNLKENRTIEIKVE